jgi:flagellar FliL protein
MADEELESESESTIPESGTRSKIIKILIIIAIILGSLIVVFVISYLVAKSVKGEEYEETATVAIVKSPPPLDTYTFNDEFRINTKDVESTHFVKMRISLAFHAGQLGLQTELTKRDPQMRDLVNIIIQGKKKSEITGQVNQLDLREEIKAQINHILREGEIKDIYFLEFIVN